MTEDSRPNGPTRRKTLKLGGVVVGASMLAGCDGDDGGVTDTPTDEPAPTTDDDAENTPAETDTVTPTDASYSVTMSPVGEVTFEDVPTSVVAYYPISAGTTLALGHGDALDAIGYDKQLFGDTVDYYYDRLDSVAFDWEALGRVTPSDDPNALDKEAFYELDCDVHFLDPALLRSQSFGWSEADVEAIASNVGPWFGNYYSRNNGQPPEAYREGYEYYGLWEYIGKIADVFQERERFETLRSIRTDLLARIEADLPPESERPTVAIVAYSDGTFWPYAFQGPGYMWDHVRPMGVRNAFETTEGGPGADGAYDFEGIAEAEPDVMLRYWGTALGETFVDAREAVLDHSLAEEIPALDNERYYPSAHGMQGPIMNLFNLEMTAKQLYPEVFGAWPGYGDGAAYPEVPADEQLFDRQRVAAIANGEI